MLGDLHLLETFCWISLFKGLACPKSVVGRIPTSSSASVVNDRILEKPLLMP